MGTRTIQEASHHHHGEENVHHPGRLAGGNRQLPHQEAEGGLQLLQLQLRGVQH